jgi:prepilin-type N-terminal cleavage/methylation domain-containing protein/prepilin-type processing-associated H-X9-DG protein
MKNVLTKVKRGFTLIELLVVIAIIGLLAAILFPVFAQARENARRSSCQSNLKQLGISFMQYAQDFDETQIFDDMPNSPNWSNIWMYQMQPYISNYEILRCPSDTNPNRPAANSGHSSYVINDMYDNMDSGNYGAVSTRYNQLGNVTVRLSQIQAPATTVMAADNTGGDECLMAGNVTRWSWEAGNFTYYPSQVLPSKGFRVLHSIGERHLGTTNVLYCDGHVKAVKLDKFVENQITFITDRGNSKVGVMTAFTARDD